MVFTATDSPGDHRQWCSLLQTVVVTTVSVVHCYSPGDHRQWCSLLQAVVVTTVSVVHCYSPGDHRQSSTTRHEPAQFSSVQDVIGNAHIMFCTPSLRRFPRCLCNSFMARLNAGLSDRTTIGPVSHFQGRLSSASSFHALVTASASIVKLEVETVLVALF